MNVASHLIELYARTSRRYRKLISKLQRDTASPYQRKTFLHEIEKLLKTLRRLQAQLKIAAATGAVVLMLNTGAANAQTAPGTTLGPFVKQDRLSNPLREPIFTNSDPALAVVDWDNDGDMDMVVGEHRYDYNDFGGYLRYFENLSSQETPLYVELVGDQNPFAGIRAETQGASPALSDIDGDGDLDLILGQNGYTPYDAPAPGGIEYYRNDNGVFSKQTGPWDNTTQTGNPFDHIALGPYVRPAFVDFDKDGDHDLMIGSFFSEVGYPDVYIHHFENTSNGLFVAKPIVLDYTPSASWGSISPAFADVDGDGDFDMVLGAYYDDELLYYKQVAPGTFAREFDAWDPTAGTGNPFNGLKVAASPSPAFIDFDDDGNLDLFVADQSGAGKYSDRIINYYRNSGNNLFEEKVAFDNPFDGVFVKANASPVLLDVDGDTELDAVVGNKYDGGYYDETGQWVYSYSSLKYYKNEEEGFAEVQDDAHPLKQLEQEGYFSPQFIDVDGDSDLDIISGGSYGQVVFFRNDDGVYVNEIELSPFAGINVEFAASAKLVDIDNDGDADLFMTNGNGEVRFYRNDDGGFVELFELDNPLAQATNYTTFRTPFLKFTDIDHDGDFDVFFGGLSASQGQGALLYFENTGTPEQPSFSTPVEGVFGKGMDFLSPQAEFADFDKDGDLDSFIGNNDGTVSYFENQNPAVIASIASMPILYEPKVDSPVVVAADLTLEDSDDDLIVRALVSITDYQPGEILAFTPHDDINGFFDTESGILHLNGKATLATYESVLRTVTFEASADEAGRKKSVKATTPKDVTFAVYDIDFTHPEVARRTVDIFVNSPPDIAPEPVINTLRFERLVNLIEITSDVDDNLDPTQFTVVSQPSSGANATIVFVSTEEVNLVIDYEGVPYSGVDELTIRACDDAGACTDRVLAITVDVDSGIIVYNAIAPNSSGDNGFMRITGLPVDNTVRIFSRWGDKVYEVNNYENTRSGNAFRGRNNEGNDLPSGTYFYTIEVAGKKRVTGYLTLKQ